jgi:hypothetical protein
VKGETRGKGRGARNGGQRAKGETDGRWRIAVARMKEGRHLRHAQDMQSSDVGLVSEIFRINLVFENETVDQSYYPNNRCRFGILGGLKPWPETDLTEYANGV